VSSTAHSSRPEPAITDRLARLERRLARERAARQDAETISERATRELYGALNDLRRAHDLTGLLGEIAVAANQADGEERVLQVALDRICEHMGWPVGHALALSSNGVLRSTRIWHLDDEAYEPFRAISEELEFPAGTGLPGRVLETGEPAGIEDVTYDPNFPRNTVAVATGLHAAFGFPILVRRDVHAVLEFFSPTDVPIDAPLLEVMGQIGEQLGRVRERRLAEDRMAQLAMHDSLTGLANRSLLVEHLEGALAGCRRSGDSVSVVFLDIDDFKSINDSLGHDIGDGVLCGIAARLRETLRASDVVARAGTSTIARFGGDEFAIVLDGCDVPEVVAARIMEALHAPMHFGAQEVFVSASAGGAVADLKLGSEDVIRAANVAMHVAKQTGKRRYQGFDPAMYDEAIRRHRLTAALRRAIEADQLRVHYQPEFDVVTGGITAVEALVRWQHPDFGLVQPGDFISVAEDTGLIIDLGQWVLRAACEQAARWTAQHPQLAGITMAVNVSGRQLRDPEFPATVADVLAGSGLAPERLCLEVTETVLVEHMSVVEGVVEAIRGLAVRFAIDDFGTGYSSLSTLKHLPVDILKIDQSFLRNVPEDEIAGSFVWTIANLGHRLGLLVIAEGIETAQQLDALVGYGCDVAQGYHLARPVPAEEVLPRLLQAPRLPLLLV
jgi:diguanylate cyclase (GGDEF)-like protein